MKIIRVAKPMAVGAVIVWQVTQPVVAQTAKTITMSGAAPIVCGMGITNFAVSFSNSSNSVSNLTFDDSQTDNASGNNKNAIVTKSYTLKCNSSSKTLTISALPAITGANSKSYTVNIRSGNASGPIVGTASTNGSAAGSGSFTPGLVNMTVGATYTIEVIVTARNTDNTANYSTSFSIQ